MSVVFKDSVTRNPKPRAAMGLSLIEKDSIKVPARGFVSIRLDHQDGHSENIYLGENHIMFEARLLMAEVLKFNFNKGQTPVNGITHLAVGVGGPFTINGVTRPYDLQNPPVPGVDIYNENRAGTYDLNGDGLSELVKEIARKEVTATYVDEFGGATLSRTSVVDFTATFGLNEANDTLVEMALFGGSGASDPNSGTMFAVKEFPVINKRSTMAMTITYRLAF